MSELEFCDCDCDCDGDGDCDCEREAGRACARRDGAGKKGGKGRAAGRLERSGVAGRTKRSAGDFRGFEDSRGVLSIRRVTGLGMDDG